MKKELHKVFFFEKKNWIKYFSYLLALLALLGHKEAIGTLGYNSFKTGGLVRV